MGGVSLCQMADFITQLWKILIQAFAVWNNVCARALTTKESEMLSGLVGVVCLCMFLSIERTLKTTHQQLIAAVARIGEASLALSGEKGEFY